MPRVKYALRAKYRGRGDLKKTENFLNRILKQEYVKDVDEIGQEGVDALLEATPKRTGLTSRSWEYKTDGRGRQGKSIRLQWYNTNVQDHVNVAYVLDQGHVTQRGNWVEGRHYIKPALEPVLTRGSDRIWKEVTKE